MSAQERRERLAESIREALHSLCDELVVRDGHEEECGRWAIALRLNVHPAGCRHPEVCRCPGEYDGRPYPVCRRHARRPLVSLDLIYAALDTGSGGSERCPALDEGYAQCYLRLGHAGPCDTGSGGQGA